MAVEYIKGSNFGLYIGIDGTNYPICHADDCSIEMTSGSVETTTKNGLNAKTYNYYGKYGYTLTLSGITNTIDVANFSIIQDAIKNSTKLPFIFTDNDNILWSGTVLIPSISIDSPSNGISHFNNAMLGDGELTKVTEGIIPPSPGGSVDIINQFGNILASISAPGSYSVTQFDTLDLSGWNNPDITITSQAALPS